MPPEPRFHFAFGSVWIVTFNHILGAVSPNVPIPNDFGNLPLPCTEERA